MNKTLFTASLALSAITPLIAQDAKPQGESVRITIKTNSEMTQERKTLVDGEEMGFGGRGGGAGGAARPTTVAATLVFDQGQVGDATWRNYVTAEAKQTRAGRNGEPRETIVKSALDGKKVFFSQQADKLVAFENAPDGKEIAEQVVRGIPAKVDVAALVPTGDLVEGGAVEFNAAFRNAVASLVHPIRAAREEAATEGAPRRRGGGEGEGEGQGGQRRRGGGEEGEGGQRRRRGGEGEGEGQGGQRRRGGGAFQQRAQRQVDDAALTLLANKKLEWIGKGQVISIEQGIAKIDFTIEVKGEGSLKELGLELGGMARMRGRGGRGGGQGGGEREAPPEPTGEGQASMMLTGTILANAKSRGLQQLNLTGKLQSVADSVMIRNMRGEEMEIETHQETDGSLSLEVRCEPTPKQK